MSHSTLSKRSLCFWSLILCFAAFAAEAAHAQATKLNGSTAQNATTYSNSKVSPNGAFVVYQNYVTTADEYGTYTQSKDLFVVAPTGGAPKRLTNLGADKEVYEYLITSDSRFVVFRADRTVANQYELYSVPINGGAIEKINAPLAEGRDVEDNFKLSPDGRFAVYQAEDGNSDDQLYAAFVRGSNGRALDVAATLPDGDRGGDVDDNDWLITPDSRYIIFDYEYEIVTGQTEPDEDGNQYDITEEKEGWYSISTANGTVRLLSDIKRYADEYRVTSDSSYFVYNDDRNDDGDNELYSVPVAGGARKRLSAAGEGDIDSFKVPARYDGFVIYKASRLNPATPSESDSLSTFVGVTLDATQRYRIPTNYEVGDWAIAPNDRGIAFIAEDKVTVTFPQDTGGTITEQVNVERLFSITTESSGQPREIGLPISTQNRYDYENFLSSYSAAQDDYDPTETGIQFTPDGTRLLFRADKQIDRYSRTGDRLYTVALAGGAAPIELNVPFANNSEAGVTNFLLTSDGRRVVYNYPVQIEIDEYGYPVYRHDLYVTAANGTATSRLVVSNANPDDFRFAASNRRLVFERTTTNGNDPADPYDDTSIIDLFSIAMPN